MTTIFFLANYNFLHNLILYQNYNSRTLLRFAFLLLKRKPRIFRRLLVAQSRSLPGSFDQNPPSGGPALGRVARIKGGSTISHYRGTSTAPEWGPCHKSRARMLLATGGPRQSGYLTSDRS